MNIRSCGSGAQLGLIDFNIKTSDANKNQTWPVEGIVPNSQYFCNVSLSKTPMVHKFKGNSTAFFIHHDNTPVEVRHGSLQNSLLICAWKETS